MTSAKHHVRWSYILQLGGCKGGRIVYDHDSFVLGIRGVFVELRSLRLSSVAYGFFRPSIHRVSAMPSSEFGGFPVGEHEVFGPFISFYSALVTLCEQRVFDGNDGALGKQS